MKKYSLRFILTCLAILAMGVSEARADIYLVKTAQDFIFHWRLNHSICIMDDIDLSSFKESDYCLKYTGELSSMRLDKCSNYALKNIPEMMAKEMEGAYIHDIEIKDSKPDWDRGAYNTNYGTSVLARYAKNCRVERVILTNITIYGDDYTGASSYGACLFCHDEGSSFEEIEAYGCKVYTNSCYAGIFCGETKGSQFKNVVSHVGCAVYAGGSLDNAYAGGLVGYAEGGSFYDCHNLSLVAGNADCIGGIAGKSDGTTFEICNNYGSVSHKVISTLESLENTTKLSTSAVGSLGSDEIDRLIEKGLSPDYFDMIKSSAAGLGAANSYFSSPNVVYEAKLAEIMNAPEFELNYNQSLQQLANQYNWSSIKVAQQTPRRYAQNMLRDQQGIGSARDIQPGQMSNSKYMSRIGTTFAIILQIYEISKAIYNMQDHDNVGGIVGLMKGGSATRCTNYGYIFSADAYAGGIAGQAYTPSIVNCMNQGCVKGYEQTGGIVGQIQGGSLKTNMNIGNVSSGNSSSKTFGRIYGESKEGTNISHNVYASNKNTTNGETHCAEVTLKMLATGEAASLLNQYAGENVWRQTLGVDYFPELGHASDSLIAVDQSIEPTVRTKYASNFLRALSLQYSDIVLTGDIDLNTSLANFSSRLMPFYGSIDGQGHRLKNLYYVCDQENKGGLSNDNENTNIGMLSYARNATFKNLELCNFNVVVVENTDTCALFVGNSANCTYENIHLTGHSSITPPSGVNRRVGGIVGFSQYDKFTDCSTGPLCHFEGKCSYVAEEIVVGGLVGEAIGTTFTSCCNKAEVVNDNDCTGGIVAKITNGKIERCLNMGLIQGAEYLGGVVGLAEDTEIYMCANTGIVNCIATLQESEVGGIVGRYVKDNGNKALYECANWGNIHRSAGENQGAIYGETSGSPSVHDNYYCFVTEDNDHPSGCLDQAYVLSGEWAAAYNADYDKHQGYYYQDIDRNSFGTHYPVPVYAAGEITKNWDCKTHKFSYSNLYNGGEDHTADANKFGICQTCGSVCAVPAYLVDIDNSQDMVDLARALSKGQSFSNHVINLTSDIDFQDNTTPFLGIGTAEHPFSGIFDGNYHTIKNLKMEAANTVPGLFSTVTGTTIIRNLIMDNTCALRSTGWGAGGIVGCSRGSTTLNLENLGFEGFVSGYKNVGAILGGTFSVEGATIDVNMHHCYNTGTVKGDTESASLCGYAANALVADSWNAGKVTGYTADHPLAHGNYTQNHSYDINATGDNHITADDVTSGKLAYYVNERISGLGSEGYSIAWYQQIGVDEYPTFIRNTDHAVYQHDCYWCDAPETLDSYYDNKKHSEAGTDILIKHDFDEDGFCTRKAGEIHGEECPVDEDCWQVTKMCHLYYIANQVNNGKEQHDIKLQADVVDNKYVIINGALSSECNSFRKWKEIGCYEHAFKKSFDGNHHTVSGLYCLGDLFAGLIGRYEISNESTTISNVGVIDSYLGSGAHSGFIAGWISDERTTAAAPTIHNCYSSGIIQNTQNTGGIVGKYYLDTEGLNATISNCYSFCKILPNTDDDFIHSCGGIIGQATNITSLDNCYYLEDANIKNYAAEHSSNNRICTLGEEKTKSAFNSGEVCKLLSQNSDKWTQEIPFDAAPCFGNNVIKYTRNVTPGSWGSLILPFPVTSDEKVQYYTFKKVSGEEDKAELHLNRASTIPANTPCFFRTSANCSELSATAALSSMVAPTSSEVKIELSAGNDVTMYLIGSYKDITVSPQDFILNYYVAQNKLWWGERAFNLGANRAYIEANYLPFFAKSLTFVVDDDETGIKPISPLGESEGVVKLLENGKIVIIKNGVKYNAAGQRIL